MEAKDLRVGNLVIATSYLKNETKKLWVEVSEIILTNSGISIEAQGYNVLEPIPLTEKWLLKFGFQITFENKDCDYFICKKRITKSKTLYSQTMEVQHHYTKRSRKIFTDIIINTMTTDAKGVKHYNYYIPLVKVNSVHQLQNLYFALTGKELKIKN